MVNRKLYLSTTFILTLFALTVTAQIEKYQLITSKVQLYGKTEWDIELKSKWENPYLMNDVKLDMILQDEKGNQYFLPCYYISGESGKKSFWKARFAPKQLGKHTYYFILSEKNQKIDSTKSSTFFVNKSKNKGILKVANNWSLKYDNGEFFRGIGENIGWESRIEDDSKYFKELHEDPRFNYEIMLKKLSLNGGNFFRTWMCEWNLPLEWKRPKNNSRYQNSNEHFNPSAISKIDRLIDLADSLNIHIMLAIDAHVNLMGDFWKNNNYNKQNGGPAETVRDFFINEDAKIQYKSKLRFMIARWGYSPAIGAWEFFNEIDHVMFGHNDSILIEHSVITNWHHEMSKFLKENDPFKHIITTSISHREINGLYELEHIDINQKHIYCYTDGIPGVIEEKSKHSKPYMIGEYGYHWDWSKNFDEYGEEFDRDLKKGLWYGLFSPTPILPMTWWWEYFDQRGSIEYLNKVNKINDLMISRGKGEFKKIEIDDKNNNTTSLGVKCGESIFIYCINNTKTKQEINITLPKLAANIKYYKIFDTTKGKFSDKTRINISKDNYNLNKILLNMNDDCIIIIN